MRSCVSLCAVNIYIRLIKPKTHKPMEIRKGVRKREKEARVLRVHNVFFFVCGPRERVPQIKTAEGADWLPSCPQPPGPGPSSPPHPHPNEGRRREDG